MLIISADMKKLPKSGSRLKKVYQVCGGFARETITRHQNRKRNMKCFGNVAKFFRHVLIFSFFFFFFLLVAVFLLSDKYILSPFFSRNLFCFFRNNSQFPGIETNKNVFLQKNGARLQRCSANRHNNSISNQNDVFRF